MIDSPINSLIANSDIEQINIPIFQRPYKWSKDQILQFLNDFENALEKDRGGHFLA